MPAGGVVSASWITSAVLQLAFPLPEFQLRSCYCIASVCAPMLLPWLRSRQNSRSRPALPPRLLRLHFRKLAASHLFRIPATTSLMPPCQAYRSFLSRSMHLCRLIQIDSPSQAPTPSTHHPVS